MRLIEILSNHKNQVLIMKVTTVLNCLMFVAVAMEYGCGKNVDDAMIAAGNSPAPMQQRIVEPSIDPYVSRFESDFGVRINYPVVFFDSTNKIVGQCITWNNGSHQVQLDRKFFSSSSDLGKEQLVYHELGHCEFNAAHNDNRIKFKDVDGDWPVSVMKSSVFTDDELDVYKSHRDYYLKELAP